jgi:pimeloyl-ACP methyl ester carboxylesterase
MHISCVGSGSVTVLLEAGGGSGSGNWPAAVTQPLSGRTRTCTYDRAGTGASDPPPERRRMMVDVGHDLDALLAAAKVEGRLLLVGTSFGGQVVLDWALHHPSRAAGLVILDTDWPTGDIQRTPARYQPAAQTAEEMAKDVWNAPDNVENIDYQATGPETEAAFRKLPGIPIRILSASESAECDPAQAACRRLRAAAVQLQKQWLRLSPTAVQRVVKAGHELPNEATDIVVSEIEAALAQAR